MTDCQVCEKGEVCLKLTTEELERMAGVDVRTVDINELTDLRQIEPDMSLPPKERLEAFMEQSNNIYIHRMDDYVVKVRFQDCGSGIDEIIREYLQMKYGN